jgi:hypothetical protein
MLSYSDLSEAWGNYPQEKSDDKTSDKEHFNYEVNNNNHYICSCEKCYKKMEKFFSTRINSKIQTKEKFTQNTDYIQQIKDFYNNNKNVQLLVIILLIIIIILLVKYLLTPKYKIPPYFNKYNGNMYYPPMYNPYI